MKFNSQKSNHVKQKPKFNGEKSTPKHVKFNTEDKKHGPKSNGTSINVHRKNKSKHIKFGTENDKKYGSKRNETNQRKNKPNHIKFDTEDGRKHKYKNYGNNIDVHRKNRPTHIKFDNGKKEKHETKNNRTDTVLPTQNKAKCIVFDEDGNVTEFNNIKFDPVSDSKGGKQWHEKNKPKHIAFDEDGNVTELKNDSFDPVNDSESGIKWYHKCNDEKEEENPLPKEEVEKLKSEAARLLEQESTVYNSKVSKGSEQNWINTIMSKGTVSDRIAAHVVAIQNSPVHTLSLLKNLIGMAKVSKKNECIMAIDTLAELFISDLLKPDEKLRTFERCPLSLLNKYSSGNYVSRKSRLIHWYFEDQLKEYYHNFIVSLQAAAQDSVEKTKEKAISAMYKLLSGNPEQENVLLKCLLNKLGDPQNKVASKAVYCLIQLLQNHPNMKLVVIEETEKLLFRPNVSHKAQHYGVCFLSQLRFRPEDSEAARSLIKIYFYFFNACVKKGDVDSRLMKVLLIGVNRAYPYAKKNLGNLKEHIDTLYRVVHNTNFNVSLYTLYLLHQVADYSHTMTDRFYSALYKKILDPQLSNSKQQAIFLNLMFKALTKDDNIERVKVFFKRLLQACEYWPVNLVCGILYMLAQLLKIKKNILAVNLIPISPVIGYDDDSEDEHYEDIKTEDSENADTSIVNRVPEEEEEEEDKKDIVKPTWFHYKNQPAEVKKRNKNVGYDPMQRNPVFAGGNHCAYTELLKLSQHFHPTVKLFASNILQGETINYSGDPLLDFSLSKFLERYVFKNPKQNIREHAAKFSTFSRKKMYLPVGIRSLRVDSSSYLNEEYSKIPEDELFLYRYLKKKIGIGINDKVKIKNEDDDDDDDDDNSSVNSEEFNEMLDGMFEKEKELDFAEEVAKSAVPKKDKAKKSKDDEDADTEDENESDEEQADSLYEDGDSDVMNEDLDDDAEAIEFDESGSDLDLEDDDFGSEEEIKPNKKRKHMKDKMKKLGGSDFVSADEFSQMLEKMGQSGLKMSGSSAVSNKDNAGEKQLKWEASRDNWLKRGGKKSEKKKDNKRKWGGKQGEKRNERNVKKMRKK